MLNNISISDLIAMAEKSSANYIISTGVSKCSFSIVNNINGKRLSFSKTLSKTIDLADKVYILPVPEQGKLLLANAPISTKASIGNVSGKDKKICYSASLVNVITTAFRLDFSDKTSMSFSDIEYDVINGVNVASVDLGMANIEGVENETNLDSES